VKGVDASSHSKKLAKAILFQGNLEKENLFVLKGGIIKQGIIMMEYKLLVLIRRY